MNEQQRKLRKAKIAEMQIALQVALEKLDELKKQLAGRKSVDNAAAEQSNRLARQVAVGLTKAGILSKKP